MTLDAVVPRVVTRGGSPLSAMENQVAVTGSARGVGLGIAQEVSGAGGTAVIVDLDQSAAGGPFNFQSFD